ncbi:MAG: alpha-galactosidase [Clostridia bacterium]|nr:alpha-galactosidase [Clostridia bacterium]
MKFNFKDCYASYEDGILVIGNSLIERKISLENGIPASCYVLNKKTGYKFEAKEGKKNVMFSVPGFDFASSRVSVYASTDDRGGFSNEALTVEVHFEKENQAVYANFRVYPDCAYISSSLSLGGVFGYGIETKVCEEEYEGYTKRYDECIECVGMNEEHVKVTEVEFYDFTDVRNNAVRKRERLAFFNSYLNADTYKGQMFILDAYTKKNALVLVKESPSAFSRLYDSEYDMRYDIYEGAHLKGYGADFSGKQLFTPDIFLYYSTVGVAENADEAAQSYKKYYRLEWKEGDNGTFIMSNTWGDGNGDSRVCHEFACREADMGKKLGVDIIQLDDGWQSGLTKNSQLIENNSEALWGSGYHNSRGDFWEPAKHKFPEGFKKTSDYIVSKGAHFGLWFSPDFENDYENVDKDIEVLVGHFEKYNVTFFKIDGVNITSKKMETNLVKLVETVNKRCGGKVNFDFDITGNQKRWGYLVNKHFGNLFLENRYAKHANYYPFATLRQIWLLSEFLPSQRFQVEVLNRKLKNEVYNSEDSLAPINYTQDYIFATAMFACPLIWMEMTGLDKEDAAAISKIAKIHKKIKKDMAHLTVTPIGEEPFGTNFTGFTALDENGNGYALLFRDYTSKSTYTFKKVLPKGAVLEYMYSNFDAVAENVGGDIRFKASAQRSFVLVKVK